ncbi:hypothetical protein QCA50_003151 [Cerrena zonata]|uniref:Uncharacterized protein n=1 Tax=Cerrena zonata TaxID=2478898 RepID=A0AAW0GUB1_9APHY
MAPPASAPPSARPVLGINTFREEAQGLLLSHPMTWLDEKLFGWNSGSNSGDTSRVGTPDGSEEEPDYDQFLLSLEGKTPAVSRVGSYADLQRSRRSSGTGRSSKTSPVMTYRDMDVTGTELHNDDGLHMRATPRNRRHTLSDRVPVERIAQLGRRESFEEGAAELNKEIFLRKSEHGHQE